MRYLVGFVFVLALGTLRLVGCGDDDSLRPCSETTDCAVLSDKPPHWTLPNDRCTHAWCSSGYCRTRAVNCREDLGEGGCRTVQLIECDPEADEVCGSLTPIERMQGKGCDTSGEGVECFGYKCHDGDCTCPSGDFCICRGDISASP
jgi:hypothetical protein